MIINSNINQKEKYLKSFLYALGLSALLFLPFVIIDKGYFFYFGDFNVQQISFYKVAHEAVRSGDIFWSWYTDLGANFIGSYSFYLLGSPYFWLTIPFPTSFVPHLMAPLFCLKFATASFTAYAYVTRFIKNKNFALLAGLLYAFSGFSIYNIFFNHFHECIAFFPLMLIGLEEYMTKGKRGIFALAVFFNATVNYFFFVGEVVFLIIYFIARVSTGGFKLTKVKFLTLAIESILGFGLSCILLVPSIIAIMDNPRVSSQLYGWNALLYSENQKYLQIIQSFFFPPELPSRPNFFPDANVKWSSVAGWLPFVGMSGVISFMSFKKKNFLKPVIITCIIFAMVPFLNSAFYAFNSSYYARWFYMPVLMMSLATAITFDNKKIDYKNGILTNSMICLIFIVLIGFMPNKNGDNQFVLGLHKYTDRFWIYSAIVILCCMFIWVIYDKFYKTKLFEKFVLIATCCIVLVSSYYHIGLGKSHSETTDFLINQALKARDNFDLPVDESSDNQFFRIDVYNSMDNLGMFWRLPTINAFHSVVPASIMSFYDSIGITRDVASRPEISHWGIRSLLSVKYVFAETPEKLDNNSAQDPSLSMFGMKYMNSQNGFDIYENQNFLPMGFTYDKYTSDLIFSLDKQNIEYALLYCIYLDPDQVDKYSHMYDLADYNDYSTITQDECPGIIDQRRAETVHYFEKDNHGFTAKINTDREELVFFSVPYEAGWSATVDGQPVEVENVNLGFMAVPVSGAGEHTIRFNYSTPGIKTGIIISASCLILFVIYILLIKSNKIASDDFEPTQDGFFEDIYEEEIMQINNYISDDNINSDNDSNICDCDSDHDCDDYDCDCDDDSDCSCDD